MPFRAPGAGQTSKTHPTKSGQIAFRYPVTDAAMWPQGSASLISGLPNYNSVLTDVRDHFKVRGHLPAVPQWQDLHEGGSLGT